jgi:hypothetical protein
VSGLKFTDEAAKRLEALYKTSDVVAQRSETIRKLRLVKGNSVIDIGSGPGFLCESMADIVGASGRVVGIDISPELVECSARRNQRTWLSYRWVTQQQSTNRMRASMSLLVPRSQITSQRSTKPYQKRFAFSSLVGAPVRRDGLGWSDLAVGRSGPNGCCHEVVGSALRSSTPAPHHGPAVGGRRVRVGRGECFSDPQSPME